MEHLNGANGFGNEYTTEYRQYDPRLGRWTSVDPLAHEFPGMSPYVAFNNNPILYTDPDGQAAINWCNVGYALKQGASYVADNAAGFMASQAIEMGMMGNGGVDFGGDFSLTQSSSSNSTMLEAVEVNGDAVQSNKKPPVNWWRYIFNRRYRMQVLQSKGKQERAQKIADKINSKNGNNGTVPQTSRANIGNFNISQNTNTTITTPKSIPPPQSTAGAIPNEVGSYALTNDNRIIDIGDPAPSGSGGFVWKSGPYQGQRIIMDSEGNIMDPGNTNQILYRNPALLENSSVRLPAGLERQNIQMIPAGGTYTDFNGVQRTVTVDTIFYWTPRQTRHVIIGQ